jgi:hypothetical protein
MGNGDVGSIGPISTNGWVMEEVVSLVTNQAGKQSSALHTLGYRTKLTLVRSCSPVRIEKVPNTLVAHLT